MAEASWAANEFGEVDLGDPRRTKRLIRLAEERSEKPNGSIAASCGGKAGTKAAYRFLDNEAVGAEAILEGHYQASAERAGQERIVLAIQDTTELNYSSHPATQGLGYLNGLQYRGMYVHSTLLVTPQRVPLGLIDQQVWMRSEEEYKIDQERRKQLPTEEKESQKWLVSLEATARLQQRLEQTRVINVGDSEADIFDLFLKAKKLNQDLLVRACQDRLVDQEGRKLRAHLQNQPLAGDILLQVPRRAGQATRTAHLEVRFAAVSIRPPLRRAKEQLPSAQLWAVLAQEIGAPADVEAIDWLLITTLTVETFDQACTCMRWYTCRWVIETYHKVLKSGCRVEERQFGDADNLQRYLAVDAVVAWRVLYLTMLGRDQPDLPCTVVLETHEWQALFCFIHQVKHPPQTIPSLQQATRWIAQLGGFLGRKSDGFPGPMSIWRGLLRLSDIADAWLVFHAD
jgi:hypothetical protein